jgi:hypothetical protein
MQAAIDRSSPLTICDPQWVNNARDIRSLLH